MHKSKGRVKSACKRVFLGEDSSSAEDEHAEESTTWCFEGCLEGEGEEWECSTAACSDEEGHVVVKIEEDAVVEPENSWGQPLTSDDLSTESSETEMEKSSWSCPQSHSSSSFCKSHSGIVLKLKKVYCANSRRGQVLHYQRVQENSEPQDLRNSECRHRNCHSKKEHPVSKNKKRDTFSTKVRRKRYHTYLATQGASKHRRRWVLRSAVQRARQALRKRFPDLVGKRIHHLYEENDKTEVWYRGMVLRIHEPHPNPLKTVFEVKYDSEPEWQYYLELLMDYKKGWLKIED